MQQILAKTKKSKVTIKSMLLRHKTHKESQLKETKVVSSGQEEKY